MKITRRHLRQMLSEIIELEEASDNVTPTEVSPDGHEETPAWYTSLVSAIDKLHVNEKETRDQVNKITKRLKKSGISEQKLTRQHLRQIIKEELNLILESPADDYLNGLKAQIQGQVIDSISQMAQTDELELSEEGMGEIQDALSDGVFKAVRKEEETASFGWEVEDLRDTLVDSGIPEDDVDQMIDDLSFISAASVQKGALDAVFGEGSFDGISIGDMFANSAELIDIIDDKRTKTPASKKEYNGPKGKGQTRYIVTSQLTSWDGEGDPDYDTSVFYLVDTVDGTKFEVKGSELPYILPTTEGEIEIFDILPSPSSKESHLVADLNGKEFRLARKDI